MTGSLISMVAVVAVGLMAWLLPRHGIRDRLARWRRVRDRVRVEDVLKHMLALDRRGAQATVESIGATAGLGPRSVPSLVAEIEREGLIESRSGVLTLTPGGREYALQIVRAHRLWERYLGDETDTPLTAIHEEADRVEHRLSIDEANALDAQLGHPPTDPHGDPIPTADGEIGPFPGVPLTDLQPGIESEVTHLEDEPPGVFETIVRHGITRGTRVRVTERRPGVVRLLAQGREIALPSVAAANVHVGPIREAVAYPPDVIRLADLRKGVVGEVVGIDDSVRGLTRRRLLDLGVTPGAHIRPDLEPLFGRPRAFRIRDTLVALRDEQAAGIRVRPVAPDIEAEAS